MVEARTFGELLARAIDTIRTPAGTSWTSQRLAAKLNKSERTVRNWRNGITIPAAPDLDALEDMLFGSNPAHTATRERLRGAWVTERNSGRAAEALGSGTTLPPPKPILRPQRWFGRAEDVARLTEAVLVEGHRAVLALGPGGIGKTSLTQRVATDDSVAARFMRRWFVPLETAESAAVMGTTIAQTIGLDPSAPFEAVLARLREEPGLLVLDNLETPWERAHDAVEEMLGRLLDIDGVALLASMRGQAAPPEPRWFSHIVAPLAEADAAALFSEFAPRIPAEDPHLVPLLRDLGGVPLAIGLVARRAAGFSSLDDLWAEWQRQGITLAADPDREEGRLTSVRRSIAFSLGSPRLKAGGWRLFRLLGQLPAGILRKDRDALLRTASFEATQQLLSVGLAYEREGRLDLLPPVRDFARREHPPTGLDAEAWVMLFLGEVVRDQRKFSTRSGAEAIARLSSEVPNIEAAMRAARTETLRRAAASTALAFGHLCSRIGEDGGALRDLAAACKAADDIMGEADCIYSLAEIARARCEDDAARDGYGAAVVKYREIENLLGEANCLHSLAEIARTRAEYEAAHEGYSSALALYRKARDISGGKTSSSTGPANCIQGLAEISSRRGEFEAAREGHSAALALFREAGNVLGEANCIRSLADIARDRSEHEAGREGYSAALALYRKVGDILGEANCIKSLADIARDRSEHEAAREGYSAALALYRKVGSVLGETHCVWGLGNVARELGDTSAARVFLEQALTFCKASKVLLNETFCRVGLAALADNAQEAAAEFDSALTIFRQLGSLSGEATALDTWAQHLTAHGDTTSAKRLTSAAINVWERLGNRYRAEKGRTQLAALNGPGECSPD